MAKQRLLTSHQIAQALQVNRRSVNNWVNAGWLEAFRTPGGHRRIRHEHVIAFLRERNIPIPPQLRPERARVMLADADARRRDEIAGELNERVELSLVPGAVEALLEISDFRPHLIVLGAGATGVDVLEICRRLGQLPLTRNIRLLVALPNASEESAAAEATEAGAHRVVSSGSLDAQVVLEELVATGAPVPEADTSLAA